MIADTVGENLERLSAWMVWAIPAAGTVESQHRRIPETINAWDDGTSFQYVLVQARTGALLGGCGLERRVGPRAIELGYWLGENATGQGHATAAAGALTAAALQLSGVDRVEIHCDELNRRSRLIPQRLGYRLDRVQKSDVKARAGSGRSLVWIYPG